MTSKRAFGDFQMANLFIGRARARNNNDEQSRANNAYYYIVINIEL